MALTELGVEDVEEEEREMETGLPVLDNWDFETIAQS